MGVHEDTRNSKSQTMPMSIISQKIKEKITRKRCNVKQKQRGDKQLVGHRVSKINDTLFVIK